MSTSLDNLALYNEALEKAAELDEFGFWYWLSKQEMARAWNIRSIVCDALYPDLGPFQHRNLYPPLRAEAERLGMTIPISSEVQDVREPY